MDLYFLDESKMIAPLVTIITVTYNSSKYVRDAIEGVLAQTYTNIEYIIGDDCSTDDTWSIIREYKDPRIKAYRNETNLGEYPNRNKAILMSTGEYLLFIDGDDYIYPHGLSYYVDLITKYPQAAIMTLLFHPLAPWYLQHLLPLLEFLQLKPP